MVIYFQIMQANLICIDLYGARNVSVFILILLGTFELLTKHVELFIKKSFSLNSN
jgi:hypothetical protein